MAEHQASRAKPIDNNTVSIKEEDTDSGNTVPSESAYVNVNNDRSGAKQLRSVVALELAQADTKNEPDVEIKVDVADVEIEWTPDAAAAKREVDVGLTVLQPPDTRFMPQPCKPEPADSKLLELTSRSGAKTRAMKPKLVTPKAEAEHSSPKRASRSAGASRAKKAKKGELGAPKAAETEDLSRSPTSTKFAALTNEETEEMMGPQDRPHMEQWLEALPSAPCNSPPGIGCEAVSVQPLAALPSGEGSREGVVSVASPGQTHPYLQRLASLVAGPSGVPQVSTAASLTGPPYDSGSEFDWEWDDLFDAPDLFAPAVGDREMPPGETSDEEATATFLKADRAMDDAQAVLPDIPFGFGWSEDYGTFRGKRETFTGGPPGPTRRFDTPLDAFLAIWDESIMQVIADETNRYAWQFLAEKNEKGTLPASSRYNQWVETDVQELYRLFALYIVMGFTPRMWVGDYWNTSRFFDVPGIRSLMSHDRYKLLDRFLHFIDNHEVADPHHEAKLHKLKPIVDHCNARFQELYTLGEHVLIDESLTLWKGRLSWAQCVRTKAARFGIRSFELCESSTGYLWRFAIYTGKGSGQSSGEMVTELAGKSTAIVLELLRGLEDKGYCLTMDNYFNSPCLARYLKARGFDCVGTVRVNRRHVPDAIKLEQSAKVGTVVARHSGDVSVLSWRYSKVVSMISTFHDAKTSMTTKAGVPVSKPIVVQDYNRYMGGVDRKDQKLSVYLSERKRGLKWYIKMFKRLLNVSVHNAFVLQQKSTLVPGVIPLTHRQFRVELATALLEKYPHMVSCVNPTAVELRLISNRDVVHTPKSVPSIKRRRCARCSQRKVRKATTLLCDTCDVGLCFGDCWRDYHSKTDLS